MPDQRIQGTVIKLAADKGFGFIRGEDGREYFFHRSGLRGYNWEDLQIRSTVSFIVRENPKGPRAEEVEVGQ